MTLQRIGVLTSGGDSPGMNAAIRAVIRCGIGRGLEVFGIYEGWQGTVDGGEKIRRLTWRDAGGILQRGGTVLGTARSAAFRQRDGRKQAAYNLFGQGITGLVVIGGDGSLTGAKVFADDWPDLIRELAAEGRLSLPEDAEAPPLQVVGLPGSIDNDLYGTDMSIGADTALHTIVRAVDQLESTASAHQRTFVVEVMGRNCGYLALTSALASGGHWVLIPEEEMDRRWHQRMVKSLERGRVAGRRHATVIFAEGARHTDGLLIQANQIVNILKERLQAEARVTVLGHVQRGGVASAFDRNLATRLGAAAVDDLLDAPSDAPPRMIGLINNETVTTSLDEVVARSREVGEALDVGNYERALTLRGHSFRDQLRLLKMMTQAEAAEPDGAGLGNIAIITAGADAPGMNAALRVAVRQALDAGANVFGVRNGFRGLVNGAFQELNWMSVSGWVSQGGTNLGSVRYEFQPDDFARLDKVMQQHAIRGLVVLGGLSAYQNVAEMLRWRSRYSSLNIPIICIPATIDNNLPATDYSIGADTALNSVVDAVDKIKYTASSAHRAFVVEVMGGDCGYLPLMAALASGAEQAYLPEEGITLEQLAADVRELREGFRRGKSLGIMIMGEHASRYYNTDVIRRVVEEEGGEEFDVRTAILGHLQRGGTPTPFDRIQASRFAHHAMQHLLHEMRERESGVGCIGLVGKRIEVTPLLDALALLDADAGRPREEWWLQLRPLARRLSTPDPDVDGQ